MRTGAARRANGPSDRTRASPEYKVARRRPGGRRRVTPNLAGGVEPTRVSAEPQASKKITTGADISTGGSVTSANWTMMLTSMAVGGKAIGSGKRLIGSRGTGVIENHGAA